MTTERARIKKNEMESVLKARLRSVGFETSRSNAEALWFRKGAIKGWFLWDKDKRAWSVRMDFMTVYTQEDLETLLGEVAWMQTALKTISEAWSRYKKTKSNKSWDSYQGAVAVLLSKSARSKFTL